MQILKRKTIRKCALSFFSNKKVVDDLLFHSYKKSISDGFEPLSFNKFILNKWKFQQNSKLSKKKIFKFPSDYLHNSVTVAKLFIIIHSLLHP